MQQRASRVQAPWLAGASRVISSLMLRASDPKSPRLANSMALCSRVAMWSTPHDTRSRGDHRAPFIFASTSPSRLISSP
jgi:hypothetical protein